jgi:hypothetical protein
MEEKQKIAAEYCLSDLISSVRPFFKSQNKVAEFVGVNKAVFSQLVKGDYYNVGVSKMLIACTKLQAFAAKMEVDNTNLTEDAVALNLHRLATQGHYEDFLSYFKMIRRHFVMESFIVSS